jgi:uncharacterized damage-inducible protein DinB
MKRIVLLLVTIFTISMQAQENDLPYYEVPEYPENYTVGTVSARMVDGLGFRYYWATEGLKESDLEYKPSEDARTTSETIDHILSLSRIVLNATQKVPTDFTVNQPELTYEEKRKETLLNLEKASQTLNEVTSLEELKIKFVSKNGESEYPFWNILNGPLSDAIWHTGQVVSFRRAAGNPISSKVSFLRGTVKK